jgi:hypothetical protein
MGVRPASRSSTNTLAPPGVERTFNRPAAHALIGTGAGAGVTGAAGAGLAAAGAGAVVGGASERASDTGGGFGASGSVLSVNSRAGTDGVGVAATVEGCSRTPTA